MSNRFVNDINRLVKGQKTYQALEVVKSQPIAAIRSIGQAPGSPAAKNTGNGIASPLIEIPGTREYYDTQIMGGDGLFVLEMKAIKSAQFKDANDNVITINYAQE